MKRKGVVVSKKDYRYGRYFLKFAANGFGWAEGGNTEIFKAEAKRLLSKPDAGAKIGKIMKMFGTTWQQIDVTMVVNVASKSNTVSDWENEYVLDQFYPRTKCILKHTVEMFQ